MLYVSLWYSKLTTSCLGLWSFWIHLQTPIENYNIADHYWRIAYGITGTLTQITEDHMKDMYIIHCSSYRWQMNNTYATVFPFLWLWQMLTNWVQFFVFRFFFFFFVGWQSGQRWLWRWPPYHSSSRNSKFLFGSLQTIRKLVTISRYRLSLFRITCANFFF